MDTSLCGTCLIQRPPYDYARAIVAYDDNSRNLILKFKHGDHQEISPLFGKWLKLGLGILPSSIKIDVIAPIPLHRNRLIKRRFNQASLIAKSLSRETKIPFAAELLKRTRPTESQGHLSPPARKKNLKNAFSVYKIPPFFPSKTLTDKTVLLVDDVFTTGSTVEEAAKCLKKAGASSVIILTVARVIRPQTPVL